ncbi:MAG: 30S ribosomal protein S4 [Clostridiales bacterium]|nr:30S ribosomal protein S4 [Clostridiales bacterium]
MAKYTGSVCRLCRREGAKLFLKGDRCYSGKCSFNKRPVPPGQHGQGRRKMSEYGLQLREKQKMRRAYGLLENQFRTYFDKARRQKGVNTGEALLQMLETRLDNVAYRLGFGESRPQARQLVLHGHILVNGRKVNIPSYLVSPGDTISVKESSRDIEVFKSLREGPSHTVPKWLELNADALEGKILQKPERDDIDLTLSEHLVVEYYSKL